MSSQLFREIEQLRKVAEDIVEQTLQKQISQVIHFERYQKL